MQITWGRVRPGMVRLTAKRSGERQLLAEATVEHPGGAGAADLVGLPPDTNITVEVSHPRGRKRLETRTLSAPPGAELARFATISDLHIGADEWGFLKTMAEGENHRGPSGEPYPIRCTRGALADIEAWGADHVVVKGDAAQHRHPDHFAALGSVLDDYPHLPLTLIPGNHDVDFKDASRWPTTGPPPPNPSDPSTLELPLLGQRQLRYERAAVAVDLAGCRIVAFDSTLDGRHHGTARHAAQVVDLVAEAGHQSVVLCHHHLQPSRRLTHWPPGIGAEDSLALARQLSSTGKVRLLSAGHSHRNRRWLIGGLDATEVASTKDWPGVWAGYVVHEGGVRQVIRRIPAADTVNWHDYSRGAVLGLWGPWASGALHERCAIFTDE